MTKKYVLQAMVQFIIGIEKLSHIIRTTPILERARAYGVRPRFWLLFDDVTDEFQDHPS